MLVRQFTSTHDTYSNVDVLALPQVHQLPAAKHAALSAINEACDAALNALASTYPAAEVASFNKQEAEARELIAKADAPAPLLRAIAQSRNIDVSDIAQRVITKAELFASASGRIIGHRQSLEDALDTAQTLDDINRIHWGL